MKWLKNTLTSGTIPTTASIEVDQYATISRAAALLIATNAASVSLVTPTGSLVPMSFTFPVGNATAFLMTTASAAALVGQGTGGNWSFRVTGRTLTLGGRTLRLTPSVRSGVIDLSFTNQVVTLTGPDGEYTLEYLARGSQVISIFLCDCSAKTLDLQATRTGVDFELPSVGEFVLDPVEATVAVHDPQTYALAYTITDGRNWHDLSTLQLRFTGESGDTILWVQFDTLSRRFSLVNPKDGSIGPTFPAGSPNRLETSAATLYLANTAVAPNVPDTSSVSLLLQVSFKPKAAGASYNVEVLAKDIAGHSQGPASAGIIHVEN